MRATPSYKKLLMASKDTELLNIAYDFEPMARLAERRDRPDWAIALRTGKNAINTPIVGVLRYCLCSYKKT